MSLNLKPDLALTEHYIFMVREQQVMLDRDLAFLYGVETRVLNQAVKRNMLALLPMKTSTVARKQP
jgi:hypothetical protein